MKLLILCAVMLLGTACSKAPETPVSPIPTATWSSEPVSPSPTPSASATSQPPDTYLLIQEGTDLTLKGKYEKALVPLEQAEKLTPDDPEVLQHLFLCHQGLEERPSQKSKAYKYALRVVETNPGVRSTRAQEYIEAAQTLPLQAKLPTGGQRPADVRGFDQAQLGMSEDQLQAKLGKLLKPFTGQYQRENKYVPFFIPRYFLGKRVYSVLFPFDRTTGQLAGIYIRPVKYPSGSEAEFNEMVGFVTGMYGPPDANDDLDNDMVQRRRSVWNFPSSRVHVNLTGNSDFSITWAPRGED